MSCKCNIPDEFGDCEFCCNHSGVCTAEYTEDKFSNCVCCGAEMQIDETGSWRHYSQMRLPVQERYTNHLIEEAPSDKQPNIG